jgi:hypothetical protein
MRREEGVMALNQSPLARRGFPEAQEPLAGTRELDMVDAGPEHLFQPRSLLHARRRWPLGPMTRRCPTLDNVSSR